MPTHFTNLDALIKREDFEVQADASSTPSQVVNTLPVAFLEKGSLWFEFLRKPDFQRETANWEPEKNRGFDSELLGGRPHPFDHSLEVAKEREYLCD